MGQVARLAAPPVIMMGRERVISVTDTSYRAKRDGGRLTLEDAWEVVSPETKPTSVHDAIGAIAL